MYTHNKLVRYYMNGCQRHWLFLSLSRFFSRFSHFTFTPVTRWKSLFLFYDWKNILFSLSLFSPLTLEVFSKHWLFCCCPLFHFFKKGGNEKKCKEWQNRETRERERERERKWKAWKGWRGVFHQNEACFNSLLPLCDIFIFNEKGWTRFWVRQISATVSFNLHHQPKREKGKRERERERKKLMWVCNHSNQQMPILMIKGWNVNIRTFQTYIEVETGREEKRERERKRERKKERRGREGEEFFGNQNFVKHQFHDEDEVEFLSHSFFMMRLSVNF